MAGLMPKGSVSSMGSQPGSGAPVPVPTSGDLHDELTKRFGMSLRQQNKAMYYVAGAQLVRTAGRRAVVLAVLAVLLPD